MIRIAVAALCWIGCTFSLGASVARGEETNPSALKSDEVRNIPTIGITELSQRLGEFQGKVVRLRFTARRRNAEQAGDRLTGAVEEATQLPKGVTGISDEVVLEMPKEAAGWFESIQEVVNAMVQPKTVIVRFLGRTPDPTDHGHLHAEAIGTEIRTEARGPVGVWPNIKPKEASLKVAQTKEIPTISAYALKRNSKDFENRVVRLQFSFRGNELKGDIGELYDLMPKQGYYDSEFVSVIVPPEAVGWYRRANRDSEHPRRQIVYVMVLGEPEDPLPIEKGSLHGVRVRALGREIRQGFKGPEYVW